MADFVQTIMVIDNNFSAINTNNVFFLQAVEYAADRFYGEAEEIADIHAGHGQVLATLNWMTTLNNRIEAINIFNIHSQWQTQTFEVAICA